MFFASDNWAGATPEISAALARVDGRFAAAYGNDPLTESVRQKLSDVFEHEVELWFTGTGTASNSLALAAMGRPGGLVLCSSEAHIHCDEWGATEFQSPGLKLVPLEQEAGRLRPEALAAALARMPEGNRHGHLVALSLTNATECGTVYSAAQVAQLAGMAKARGLAVHMDGARFANAVAASGETPADLTWRSGVDVLSFGGTKNGCWAAEAIVVFSPEKLNDLAARRQRAGHTFSKARFVAAQFDAYLSDGNWLRYASHANRMSELLRHGLARSGRGRVAWTSEANEVFAILPKESLARVRAEGGKAHEWPTESLPANARLGDGEVLVRLVTSWANTEEDVERFLALL